MVEFLIKRGAQTNLLDSFDVSPQHCAAFQGQPNMSEWLLYKGAWKNRFAQDEGQRPQETAAASPSDKGAKGEGEEQ